MKKLRDAEWGKRLCKFQDVCTLDRIVSSHCACVMVSKMASWSTIAALMQPLMGGIVRLQWSSTLANDVAEETLHLGVMILTPRAVSSEMVSDAALDLAPDLEGTIRCFAPLSAIHLSMALPRPPAPPTIRYDAFSSKVQERRSRRSCYICFVSPTCFQFLLWRCLLEPRQKN